MQQEGVDICVIGERLKSERERLKLTQPEFAEAAGAAKRTLIDWEKGVSSPTAVQLSALAQIGVDVLYVLKGEPTPKPPRTKAPAMAPAISVPEEGGGMPDWSAYIQVPHYDVRASAGNGSVVHEENVVDHLVFKRDWVMRSMGLDPRRLALIDVRGDSMSPTINDGDLILLDTREGQQTTEGIYAINLAGGLLVKRLRLRLSGAVEVVSDNERYGTETINGDQLAQLHIVGRVVWQGRRI